MRRCFGKLQRATRRALIVANGHPIKTGEILRYAFPRLDRYEGWRYRAARRAATRFAVPIGRSATGQGRPVMWVANEELQRRIDR